MSSTAGAVEGLLRELAPQVLGVLVRRHGGAFDACEDAVQEALLAAATQWPRDGVPANPRGWLVTVADRRLVDQVRGESARRRREEALALATPQSALLAPAPDEPDPAADDSLALLFLCCHPALSVPSRIALTLRAVGGLTTAQIAAAFLVPEATMAQRISRAKQTLRTAAGGRLSPPEGESGAARAAEVRHVLYLVFNEGYTTSGGEELTAPRLSVEAIRLTRLLRRLTPGDAETAGLLALMLLTDARRAARTGAHGALVPLEEQDRGRWDRELLDEGLELIASVLPRGRVGPYQVQAAIAAVHSEAATARETDWPQVLALYDLLLRFDANPVVALNRAVAVAMVHGPPAGLALVEELAADRRLARHHRLLAVRAHLLDRLGSDPAAAARAYREAAARTASAPERRHLTARARQAERGRTVARAETEGRAER
ncbi:RNA polymerase sigma factor [Kitasatospora sp. NPDC091335]|uniref:RNA polymerase sigma factor n=1 Tax=Kitasatospora sp. NPDC091335 TaxID=3364085 RepID=UPI00380909AA